MNRPMQLLKQHKLTNPARQPTNSLVDETAEGLKFSGKLGHAEVHHLMTEHGLAKYVSLACVLYGLVYELL